MARIFHIATAADWAAAQRSGAYTTSTRGRTLAEEGFIHASRGDQWPAVRERYYADVAEPLVLLDIDTDRLGVPVVDEVVPGTGEVFPHVYGPIVPAAVVRAIPLEPGATGRSFSSYFLGELFRNVALGLLLMLLVAGGVVTGRGVDPVAGPWLGLAGGVAVWVVVLRLVRRR